MTLKRTDINLLVVLKIKVMGSPKSVETMNVSTTFVTVHIVVFNLEVGIHTRGHEMNLSGRWIIT